MPSLPFVRSNLRWNPFGEPPPEDRASLFVGGLEDWPRFLGSRHPRKFLQFVGPSGSGKTTRLRELGDRFPESPLIEWCPIRGWPPLPTPCASPIFVDDAQELSRKLLGRVVRFRTVAAATQKNLGSSFAKEGFTVMTVDVEEMMSLCRLRQFVERRLEWARRSPGALPRIGVDILADLFRCHGCDLQSIQSDLYDRYQQLEGEE